MSCSSSWWTLFRLLEILVLKKTENRKNINDLRRKPHSDCELQFFHSSITILRSGFTRLSTKLTGKMYTRQKRPGETETSLLISDIVRPLQWSYVRWLGSKALPLLRAIVVLGDLLYLNNFLSKLTSKFFLLICAQWPT